MNASHIFLYSAPSAGALPRWNSLRRMGTHIYSVTAGDEAKSVYLPRLAKSQGPFPSLSFCPSATCRRTNNQPMPRRVFRGTPAATALLGSALAGASSPRVPSRVIPFFCHRWTVFGSDFCLVSCLQGDGFGPCLGLFLGWLWVRFLCPSARGFCRRWFGCLGALG